jgi:hypothetical protein
MIISEESLVARALIELGRSRDVAPVALTANDSYVEKDQ